jgi:hypothetical protein
VDLLGAQVGAETVDGVAAPGGQIPGGIDEVGVEGLFGVAVGVEVAGLEEESLVVGDVGLPGREAEADRGDEAAFGLDVDPASPG